nr:hypothetical protein [Tessaracoccus coleopterorum]
MVRAVAGRGGAVVLDSKLDGIRLQVHRRGGEVLIVTRSLDDITARLPEVVEVVAALPGGDLVLDGEGLVLGADGRPSPFQDTAARTGTVGTAPARITPFFFDLLHAGGDDLVDLPSPSGWRCSTASCRRNCGPAGCSRLTCPRRSRSPTRCSPPGTRASS